MGDKNELDESNHDPIEEISALRFELEELEDLENADDTEVEPLDEDSEAPQSLLSEEEQEILEQEAARQEMSEFQNTLQERDKGIKAMEEAQQFLEDELEDANAEIDRLRRELDKAAVEAEEADYLRGEAEEARKQLESTLYKIQEGVEDAKVTNLRDERMHRTSRAIDMGLVMRGPMIKGLLIGALSGALLLTLILEAALFFSDKGELFTLVFGNGG